MKYVEQVLKNLKKHNPNELSSIRRLPRFLTTLAPLIEKHPSMDRQGFGESLRTERVIMFPRSFGWTIRAKYR